jgi:IS4 transposase
VPTAQAAIDCIRQFLVPPSLSAGRRAKPRLRERFGVQLVAPNKSTRSQTPRQDGRVLRRYRRRWKIERLFAWLHNFRRVVIRWEYYPENFLGMVQLACAVILLRYYEMASSLLSH